MADYFECKAEEILGYISPNEAVLENVKVEWVELGEGLCGDYDPNNPEDIEFLRFDVYVLRDNEWEWVNDASHCTRFPADATIQQRMRGLEILIKRFHEALHDDIDVSVKKLAEELSWISLEDVEKNHTSLFDVIQQAKNDGLNRKEGLDANSLKEKDWLER